MGITYVDNTEVSVNDTLIEMLTLAHERAKDRRLDIQDIDNMTAKEYGNKLGTKLRDVRRAQGLSLKNVEEGSEGEFKGIVVGSYERGDRMPGVAKLAKLASFYGLDVREVLP